MEGSVHLSRTRDSLRFLPPSRTNVYGERHTTSLCDSTAGVSNWEVLL